MDHTSTPPTVLSDTVLSDAVLSDAKRRLLAQRLSGRSVAAGAPSGIPRRDSARPVPLSPAQHGVWLADELRQGAGLFGFYRALWLRGEVDVSALRTAFDLLVRRHDVLRTTYRGGEDGPVQVVGAPAPAAFRIAPAAGATPAERRADALARARAAVAAPFDLAAGPPFSVLLLAADPGEHLLVIRMHHILTDEWSCDLLARDLEALYRAARTGERPGLPDLPVQYADYAAWLAEPAQQAAAARQVGFWRDALTGVPPVLELPTDHVRPDEPSHRGGVQRLTLRPEASAVVHETAARHGVTVFSALLALFGVVLYRHSGQRRFAVGSLVSGRGRPEVEHLLGMFASTVAIPMDLTGEPSVGELLERTGRTVVAALDNQDARLDRVVAGLQVPREPGRNTLFQVLFQCAEVSAHEWRLAGLDCEPVWLDNAPAKVDLTLVAHNSPGRIDLELGYATDLYRPGTAARLLDHLANLIEAVGGDAGVRVRDADILGDAERHRAVVEWNATRAAYPADATVHGLFEAQVRRVPDHPAVWRPDGTSVSYRELNERANRLAHHLRGRGVGRESLVGVATGHSVEMFVALLGVLKAGAAYVPLDAALPAARLEWILADTAAALVVTTRSGRDALPGSYAGDVVCVDGDRAGVPAGPTHDPEPVSTSDNLLYIMYTSGSTGRPKGVMVSHRGVVNYLWWAVTGYGLAGERGAPMLGSIAFDLSVPNFWLPLIGGRCVTLLAADRGLEALAETLRRPGDFSLLKITPGHLDALRGLLGPGSVHSVRTFVVGADEVRPETVSGWRAVAPGARIINEYGPTETVVGCSTYTVNDDFDPSVSVSIGKPIANLRMYVLDSGRHPTPVGVAGELYIGGAGVARGYLHRPGLTAERFVPDPFGRPGDRLYRTGDLARYRADGDFEFLGRTDFQVKIRGYRVELGEVEARLGLHPQVTEAVAAAVTDKSGHKRLVGYVVVADRTAPPAPAELRAFLAQALPEYAVPSAFVVLDAMPLTPAGKVDRTALPEPGAQVHGFVEATTPAEKRLADLWAEILGVPLVGVHDNFFDLGGDSILAIRVVSGARAEGLLLRPQDLFRYPTIAGLAPRLSVPAALPVPAPVAATPVPQAVEQAHPGNVASVRPLGPLQAGMLFHALGGDDGAYIQMFAFEADHAVDASLLHRAWQRTVDRHDALRSVFHWRDVPRPVQVVLRHWEVPLAVLDWSADPAATGTRLESLLKREEAAAPDLSRTPPTALTLIRTGPGTTLFVWRSHHILLDGQSIDIVLDEAWTRYLGLRDGGPEPHLPAPVSGADHAAWVAALDGAADEAYWRQAMAGLAGATPLPPGTATPARAGSGVLRADAPAGLVRALGDAAAAHRVTAGVLVHAAWAVLLARHSRRDEVVFGSVVAGRSAPVPGIDAMVGVLMNTLPLRVRLVAGTGDWLSDVQRRLVDLREHERSALADVRRLSSIPAGRRLFDSIVVFHNQRHDRAVRPAGLRVLDTSHVLETGYPLVLDALWDEGLTLQLSYQFGAYHIDEARRVLEEYVAVLRALAKDPRPVLAGLDPARARSTPQAAPVAGTRTGYVAPRTDRERLLARVWADVLGAGRVGVTDNFFDLGGDSILSIQIMARALAAGWVVTTRQILTRPTIAELAAVMVPAGAAPPDGIGAAPFADAGLPAAELDRLLPAGHDVADVYQLSSMQGGMLFHALLDPDGGDDFQQLVLAVDGDLDVPTLEAAWRAVVARHAVLRSTFAWTDLSRPVQVVHRQVPVTVEHLRWPGPAASEAVRSRLRALLRQERKRGFDLAAAPPQRLQAIEHGPRSYRIVWHFHHLLLDGRSISTVLDELFSTYATLRAGNPPPEERTGTPFRAYVAWERGRNRESDRRYWREALAGAPEPTPAPMDRPDAPPGAAGTRTVVVPAHLLERLRALAQRHRLTLGTVLHAAYGVLLSRHGDRPDVLFGTTLAGRSAPLPGVDGIVGMLMNTLPLRLIAAPGTAVRDYLRDTHERYAALREHEHSAPGDVRRLSGRPSSGAMFDSIFVYDNATAGIPDPPGLRISEEEGYSQPGYPMVLSASLDRELWLGLTYQSGRMTGETAHRLLEQYLGILAGLCTEPERLADIPDGTAAPRPEVPLTPIQQWFTELAGPHDHFNQSTLLYSPEPVDPVRLDRAVRAVTAHHEGLRTRLRRDGDGRWRQTIAAEAAAAPVRVVDLSALAEADREPVLARAADEAHQELNLADGPLLRAVLFPEGRTARLLIVVHHLTVDTVSWPILVDDLSSAYQGLPLPPATSTFAEWSQRLRDYALGPDFDAEAAYWRDRPPADPTLPVDATSGANIEEYVDTVTVTLPVPQTRALLRTSAQVSPHELLLAAMTLTVAAWTGRDAVRFDVETHGREPLFDDVELFRTVGWFTAMSPFEVRLTGRDPAAAVAAVRARQAATAHHGIGYGLWRYLRDGVDTASELVFNYHGKHVTPVQAGPFTPVEGPLGAVRAADGERRHLIEVDAAITGDRLVAVFRYARNRHHRDTVTRLAERYLAEVRALVAHHAPGEPARRVPDVEVLSASERRQIPVDWNATAVPFPPGDTLSTRISHWAAVTPDAVALVTVDRQVVTFAELNTLTNRLAHRLSRRGVGPETLVGVCLRHSVELVVAMLAVLRAGGAYVPLDPEHPLDRRGYLLADSGAAVLIGSTGDGAPAGFAGTFLGLDDLADLAGEPDHPPVVPVDPENLAYVIYTSGSTGRPKGVQVTRRGLTNYLAWASGQWGEEDGGGLMTGSVTFDMAVWNMWVPLFGGHRLSMIAPDPHLGTLAAALSGGSEVSWLLVTPGHLNILRTILPDGAMRWRGTLCVGGEEVHPATAVQARKLAPHARICNVYGPTETVVVCTLFDIPDDHDPSRTVPIGKPIANTRIHLLDREFRPVPVGVTGELCIGGDGVSRGYHNRPALTAGSFVPDPYGPAGSRLYRSGDLARYREDGNIEYQGRRDRQVKIRGHRVELGEIESRLAAHPAVAEVVVVARAAEEGHHRLIAYVVLSAPVAPGDLRAYLRQDLPDHLVPALVLPIGRMPLGATGKVDRTALPEPGEAQFAGPARRPARHGLEQALMDAWSATLGTPVLDADADFFDAGGDSLLAIALMSRIRRAGLSVTLRQIEQYRTAAALADSGVVTAASAKRWELSTWLPELMATHGVPGVAVALAGPDGVTTAGFGDSGTGAVGRDTRFQIGSMTKTVTALVTVELAHRGTVDLDADVNGYLTNWGLERPVTLRQLLSHTSGLIVAKYPLFERGDPVPTLGDILAGRPPARNVPLRLVAEPGTTYQYASSNFDVVEQVLLDVTGSGVAALAGELVLEPLGLRATTFDPPPEHVALGHDARGVPLPSGWRVVPEQASGALWSSARDVGVLWDHLVRAAAGPLAVSAAREMLTEVAGNGYGLGAMVLRSGERRIVGHPGDTEGYNGLALFDRDTGAGIVVLTNGDGGQNLLAEVEREAIAGDFPFDLAVGAEAGAGRASSPTEGGNLPCESC